MQLIPASLQTTYANLLQAHLGRPHFDFDGAPFTIEKRGKLYWYVNQRGVGASPPRQRYLGPDTDAMRTRIDAMRSQRSDRDDLREACTRMVAQLRAGGIQGIDRQTGTALRALVRSGVFRLGGTLVGTQAFRHYDLELGVQLGASDAADQRLRETQDMDIACFERLASTIEDEAEPDLAQSLSDLGYKPINRLERNKPTSWRHANSVYDIDFLTPSFDDELRPTHLASLNVWAQGLHYLDFLIKDPMPAVSIYMEGLLVQVPRPERYAVHKLIVSQKCAAGSGAKARKDLQQARAIIWAMAEDRSHEINSAIAEAGSRGEQWREALDRALDLQINPDSPIQPGDSAEFAGKALGQTIRLRISASALVQMAGTGDDTIVLAIKHRPKIERMFRARFREAPGPDILLTSYNLPDT
jgi:hypothetical protein